MFIRFPNTYSIPVYILLLLWFIFFSVEETSDKSSLFLHLEAVGGELQNNNMQPCCNYHFLVFTNVTKMHTGSNVLFTPIFYVTTHKMFHFLLGIACGYIKYNKHKAKGWWRLYLYPADNTVLQLSFLTFFSFIFLMIAFIFFVIPSCSFLDFFFFF